MLQYTNEHESFLACDEFQKISVILKKGRTTQSKVMDFILTILGCIILKIDHRSRLHRFKDAFNCRSLNILYNDLENLLHFNTKFVNFVILELLLVAMQKEHNCRNRYIKLNTVVDTPTKRWNKIIFQKRVKAIVKFLIFRKIKLSSYLYDETNTLDWLCYKQKVTVILNNEINPKHNFIMMQNYIKNNYQKSIANYAYYESMNNSLKKYSKMETSNSSIDPFGDKIYWLICCGWLSVFMHYGCALFYSILLSIMYKLISEL